MNILKLLNKENLNFLDIENFIEENYNGSYERFINDEFNEYPIGETIKKIVTTISNADIFVNTLFIAIDQKNKILLDYIYNKGLLEESNKRPSSILKKKMITIKYAAAIQVISLFEVLEKIIINDSENNKIVFKILDKYCKEKINDKFYLSNKMISYFMNNGYYNLLNIFKDLLLTQKNERSTLNKISKIINDNNFENFLTLITTNLVAPNKNYYEILIHNIIMTSAKKDNNSTLIIVRLLSEHFAKNYNIFFGEYLSLSKDSESKNDVKRYLNEKISPFIAAIYKDNVEVIKYFLNNGYLLSEDEKILLSTFNEKSINEIIPDFNSQGQEEEYQKFIRILVCGESENNLSFVEKSLSRSRNYIFKKLSTWSIKSMFDLMKSNDNKIEGCSPIDLLILKNNYKFLSLILEHGYLLNNVQKNKLLTKIVVPNHKVKDEKFNNYIFLNLTEDDRINYFKFVMSEYLSLNGISKHYENFITNIDYLYPENNLIRKDKSMSDLFSIIANSEASITNLSIYSRLGNNIDFIFENKKEYAKGLYNAIVQYQDVEEKNLSEQFMFESFKFIEENYKEGYEDILSKKESNTQIFIIFKNYLISEEKKLLDKQMYNINEKPNKKRL
ncbi:TPA: hypothetical protein NV714_000182 [Escherichia coli]|nr:hypothetical protein [Escherichia coli]